MKINCISEVINRLKGILRKYGNLVIYVYDDMMNKYSLNLEETAIERDVYWYWSDKVVLDNEECYDLNAEYTIKDLIKVLSDIMDKEGPNYPVVAINLYKGRITFCEVNTYEVNTSLNRLLITGDIPEPEDRDWL